MKKKRIAKETSLARGSGQRLRLHLFSDTPKAWRLLVKIELSQDFDYGELPFSTAKPPCGNLLKNVNYYGQMGNRKRRCLLYIHNIF